MLFFFYFCIIKFISWKKKYFFRKNENLNGDKNKASRGTDHEIGWVTTAKDYAGELISGQSTSGRILVFIIVL
jgi:hypothetical protein